jgi:hyperosmotically inducible protein
MHRFRAAMALAVVLFLPCRSHANDWVSDVWITAKTKIALLTTEGFTARAVSVDTVDGRVSLFGKVASAEDKRRAEDATKQIDGVVAVRSFLEIVPPERAEAVEASDEALQLDAEAALRGDPGLLGTEIHVAAVAAGVVLLGGAARSSAEHLRAIDVVERVRGVRRVHTSVTTSTMDQALDIWNRHELRQQGRGVLDVASDLWLTAETKLRLLADARVPAPEINVDCRDQRITLFGIVPDDAAKRAAGDDAKAVSGVREVHNELQVVPTSRQPAVQARDDQLERAVIEAIFRRPEMRRAAIQAMVRNGVVRLSGSAPSQQHRLFAATVARAVPGVRAVEQDIRISAVTERTVGRPAVRRARPMRSESPTAPLDRR